MGWFQPFFVKEEVMAFRLPPNLRVSQSYTVASPGDIAALEESLPPDSRILVGLVFAERYDGFEVDCERANGALLATAGLYPWRDYPRFVTPDPDGAPVAWVSYQSSPVWWTILLVVLAPIFLLPILSAIGMKIVDWLFPGTMEMITMMMVLGMMMFIMVPMTKQLAPAKEER